MKSFVLFLLGVILIAGAVATAPLWFPYQLPFAMLGGWLAGYNWYRVFKKINNWLN